MRIIGIDPGLARVGYGIIEIENERKILLDCGVIETGNCLLYTSPSPRDLYRSRMPSSA